MAVVVRRPFRPTASERTTPISAPQTASSVVSSALWAAWGDAVGFPAELADAGLYQRRLDDTGDGWRRRIGGRMGPTVELPSGCTSDDTQLRLAVGRCIRQSGSFDVEVFAKVELPVFLSYELGAGRGTKAAAQQLSRRSARWFANFFDAKGNRYIDGGGNGAAMRIQPHVWAAYRRSPDVYLGPVLRDSLVTHGHPRGFLGAAFHALTLGSALREGRVADPARWPGVVDYLRSTSEIIRADEALAERWLPVWEDASQRTLDDAVQATCDEFALALNEAQRAAAFALEEPNERRRTYLTLLERLGGREPATRGAGANTAVLALWVARVFEDAPAEGVQLAATTLGTDTDTIATMAGALLGAVAPFSPPGPVLDHDLIAREAVRLDQLAQGETAEPFPHPDPLRWEAPTGLADALGLMDGEPAVAGLGPVELIGEVIEGQGNRPGQWQWVRTAFGQTLLIKRRRELAELPPTTWPRERALPVASVEQVRLFETPPGRHEAPIVRIDAEAAAALVEANISDAELGMLLRTVAAQGALPAAVFASLVAGRLNGSR